MCKISISFARSRRRPTLLLIDLTADKAVNASERRVQRPPEALCFLIRSGFVPMLIGSQLSFGHGVVPDLAIHANQIQYSIEWRDKLTANVVFRIKFQFSAAQRQRRGRCED